MSVLVGDEKRTIQPGDVVRVTGGQGVAWRVRGFAIEQHCQCENGCRCLQWCPECDEHVSDCEHELENVWCSCAENGCECEPIYSTERVICVMVGDDREHTHNIDDLTVIDDDAFCINCGGIGCPWG